MGDRVAPQALRDSDELRSWRLVTLLLLTGVCALIGLQTTHPISNPDFGWHVALGRWILENGTVPRLEPFTHTAPAAPMVAHQWLSQCLYALAEERVGVLGLRIGNGLLAAGLVALLYGWIRREGAAPAIALLGAVVWAVIAESRFQLRPYMLNLLFFMLAYGSLFVLRPRLTRAQLLGFFALTVLWINLHSGAILFASLVFLYALAVTLEQRLLGRARRSDEPGQGRLSRLWVLSGLTLGGIFVSPNHFHVVPYVLESGRINAGLSLEWFSIVSARAMAVHGSLFLVCFGTLTAALVATVWRRRSAVPFPRLLVVVAVSALPFVSQRFTWTSFVPILFLAGSATAWMAAGAPRVVRTVRLGSTALAISLAAASFTWALDPDRLRVWLSPNGDFRFAMFPVQAMTFLDEVNLQGHLFNGNKWGGYVLFRSHERYPVFVDGRWVTIGEQIVRDAHAISHKLPGFGNLLDRHGIEIALVHRGWMSDDQAAQGSWRPVFENFNSGVYLRRGPAFEDNMRRAANYYRARSIPFDTDRGFDERSALLASPGWAEEMGVQRMHLDQFGEHGARASTGSRRWRKGW